jgi:hypothetical protein
VGGICPASSTDGCGVEDRYARQSEENGRLGSHEGKLATYPQLWGVLGTGRVLDRS